jgi:hypothetical protein
MGSGVAQANYSFKPKTKLLHRWRRITEPGPSGIGLSRLGLDVTKGSRACLGQLRAHIESRRDAASADDPLH